MRARGVLLLVILVALGIFAALNWPAVTARTSLHLGVTRVEAPLGLVLVVGAGVVAVLYAALLAWVETASLLDGRRLARELQAQRQLADSAEASRLAELRAYLASELTALRALPESAAKNVIARVDRAEDSLRAEIDRTGNTLSAYFEELEDRLERRDPPTPPRA